MNHLSVRLKEAYQRLLDSQLVSMKEPTEENINEFLEILNFKWNSREFHLSNYFTWLYKRDKKKFYSFLNKNKLQHFAILAGGSPLCYLLKLNGIVHIYRKNKKFYAYPKNEPTETNMNESLDQIHIESWGDECVSVSNERLDYLEDLVE